MKQRIAIFASGGGSNAEKIMAYFQNHPTIEVALVVSNRQAAGVLQIAEKYGIPSITITKSNFYESEEILKTLDIYKISFIVLAGFLLLIPAYILQKYPRSVVNIHPALLPKFGGKGMYGAHVHAAVKAAGETKTGITIHFANPHYDEGDIIFQAECTVSPTDTPTDIAHNVLKLEHQHFAPTIEKLIKNR